MRSQVTDGLADRPINRQPGFEHRWRTSVRRRLPDAALVLCGALLVPTCLSLPWGGDLGLHLATVGRLQHSLVHPGNPVLAINSSSPYYSPYTVTVALLCRLFDLTPVAAMKLAALGDLCLLLTGVRTVVRVLTRARWAPVLVFVIMMLLWGTSYVAWSGFFSVASLAVCLSYPSTFALGLLLHIWALVARATGRGGRLGWTGHAVAGLLFAVLALSHQFTAVGAALGIGCLLLSRWRALGGTALPRLGLGVLVAVLVLAGWPYYHIWRLGSQMSELDPVHHALYHLHYYWLGIVALPAVVARWRRDRLDPLVLLIVAAGGIIAYGWLSGHYSLGRTIPELMLPAQIALGVELAEAPWQRWRALLSVATGIALLAGAVAQVSVVQLHTSRPLVAHVRHVLGIPLRSMTTLGRYGWITRYVRPSQVVLTDNYFAAHMSAAYGAYVVAPPWYDPALPERVQQARSAAVSEFFSGREPAGDARHVLRVYHVSWIIASRNALTPPAASGDLMAIGPHGERLLAVAPTTRPRGQR